jgi:hypothetical protein
VIIFSSSGPPTMPLSLAAFLKNVEFHYVDALSHCG